MILESPKTIVAASTLDPESQNKLLSFRKKVGEIGATATVLIIGSCSAAQANLSDFVPTDRQEIATTIGCDKPGLDINEITLYKNTVQDKQLGALVMKDVCPNGGLVVYPSTIIAPNSGASWQDPKKNYFNIRVEVRPANELLPDSKSSPYFTQAPDTNSVMVNNSTALLKPPLVSPFDTNK